MPYLARKLESAPPVPMGSFPMKAICSGFLLSAALLIAISTSTAAANTTVPERTPDAYAEPGELVNIAEIDASTSAAKVMAHQR